MHLTRPATIVTILILMVQCLHAQTLDRDWPSVVPVPAIDVPMQDVATTRAPSGEFYLTGTLQGENPQGKLDFDNGRQIKLWKSSDLKTWEEVGVVWDLNDPQGEHGRYVWMRQAHKDPSSQDSPVCWGVKAPELHYIKGDWYICFSMNNQGTGLIKSSSGKPEGPYEAHAQITLRHGDPTMFQDVKDEWGGDNAVYWLFGGGWIAKMNDDLTAIVEQPRLLMTAHQVPSKWMVENKGAKVYRDFPLTVGDHGVFLFKNRGRYYLTAAKRTNRLNAGCDDTFVAWSDTVMGPYSEKSLMVRHGGGVTVFRGPRSSAVPEYYYPQQAYYRQTIADSAKPLEEIEKARNDAPLYATFFGNDPRAIFRDRPAFVPLEWTNAKRTFDNKFGVSESTPVKPKSVITERGPWPWMKPLLPGDEIVRDIKVCAAPDAYYLSGSTISHPGKLTIWKSQDLANWEILDPVWTYEQIEWLPEKLPYPKDKSKTDWNHIFWHTYITHWNDTFYITYVIFGDSADMRGAGALKSESGKIEGPYISLGKVGGQIGPDSGPVFHAPFFEYRGKLYNSDWKDYKNAVAEAKLDVPGWKWDYQLIDDDIYDMMHRGDCSYVNCVDDTPIFVFRSSGHLDNKERARVATTYDDNYLVMETLYGPPVGKPRCIPHIALSNLFKDRDGQWWASMFGSDHCAPWMTRFGIFPLTVEKRAEDDLFIDVKMDLTDREKRIMGGGEIAEVLTVPDTLQ